MVAEPGYVAFGQHSGRVRPFSEPRAWPRFPMAEAFTDLDEFALKVGSRPLPVAQVTPWDPVTTDRRLRIEVTLADTDARLDRLACFVGGQGKVDVEWFEAGRRFAVGPRAELPPGRSRVNCTAPTAEGNRFFWFSHPWVVRSTQE